MDTLAHIWELTCDITGGLMRGFERAVTGVFGSSNARYLRKLRPKLQAINALEPKCRRLTEAELKEQTDLFRQRLQAGQTLDDLLVEAFALCRETARRVLNMRPFDVQLLGAMVLHEGNIAEMATGEGKTLVATLPAYLNGLLGRGVHIVTVNDYLARRDMEWMGRLYMTLGISVGRIERQMSTAERQKAYQCDITYGTNSEFGFDYLRDHMRPAARGDDRYPQSQQQCQRGLHYAIIDEIDSILIDEARTPLIISGSVAEDVSRCAEADQIVRQLKPEVHFEVDEQNRTVHPTDEGIRLAQRLAGVESFYTPGNMHWPHLIDTALKAHHLYRRDVDYVVKRGKVVIVDQFTGRLLPARRWRDGLHQAVEAKEGVRIKQESQTLATITRQNYFKLYEKLCGMTGTAMTEAGEFWALYGMDVVTVPTNRKVRRVNHPDCIYRTEREKQAAIVEQIQRMNQWDVLHLDHRPPRVGTILREQERSIQFQPAGAPHPEIIPRDQVVRIQRRGRPILVGTVSIEKSEAISRQLNQRGIPHQLLNAKHHEREAQIIAQAGRKGAVTIATNMAGRGTDIILGGNPETLAWSQLQQTYPTRLDVPLDQWNRLVAQIEQQEQMQEEGRQVARMGGVHVIGTERHEARRIDLQLRGRCARQGDPGSTRFYLSLEDELVRLFDPGWVAALLERLPAADGEPIRNARVARRFELLQRKIEERNFAIRKKLVEYDEVMNVQRQRVYAYRQQILDGAPCKPLILQLIDQKTQRHVERFLDFDFGADSFAQWASGVLSVPLNARDFRGMDFAAAAVHAKDKAEQLIESQLHTAIEQHLAEHLPPDPPHWEGLIRTVAGRWNLDVRPGELSGASQEELSERLIEKTRAAVRRADLAPGKRFFEPDFGFHAASTWLRQELALELDPRQIRQMSPASLTARARSHVEQFYGKLESRFGDAMPPVARSLLLQVVDAAWKDQLLAMDHLRSSVRLRRYARVDPVVQYKLEGMRLFEQMWQSVADRVTQLIFQMQHLDADAIRSAGKLPERLIPEAPAAAETTEQE